MGQDRQLRIGSHALQCFIHCRLGVLKGGESQFPCFLRGDAIRDKEYIFAFFHLSLCDGKGCGHLIVEPSGRNHVPHTAG